MNGKETESIRSNQNGELLSKKTIDDKAGRVKPSRLGRDLKKRLKKGRFDARTVRLLDTRIAILAVEATMVAYRRALESGKSVLIADGGELKEVSPDGTIKSIKEIEPSVKTQKGQIIEIK